MRATEKLSQTTPELYSDEQIARLAKIEQAIPGVIRIGDMLARANLED